jgi:hypothetical protein
VPAASSRAASRWPSRRSTCCATWCAASRRGS